MRLSPPTKIVYLLSVLFAGLAILIKLAIIPPLSFLPFETFWLAIIGYALLFVGTTFKGI